MRLVALKCSANFIIPQNEVFSSMSTSVRSSAGRLGRMAQQGNKVAILKLAGIIIVVFLLVYWVFGFLFRRRAALSG